MKRQIKRRVWITWSDHRRTRELARELKAEVIVVNSSGSIGIRHLKSTVKTIITLFQHRKCIIFVQNPSRVLAALAALFHLIWRYPLIVDRHTNFRLGKPFSFDPRVWFVVLCSEFSLRFADLTIVTNPHLKELVAQKSGNGFVLPDKIPSFPPVSINKDDICVRENAINSSKTNRVVFVCTYAEDEPVFEVLEAAKLLPKNVQIFITGNYTKQNRFSPDTVSSNVILTGFVSESQYLKLLRSADVVVDFTSLDWCLVCGGYEAMAVGKPFVTSNSEALREYYENAAIFCEHTPQDIAAAIKSALTSTKKLRSLISQLAEKRDQEWSEKFSDLEKIIDGFC